MKKDKSTKRKPGIDAFDIGAIVAVVVPVVVLLLSLFLVFVLEWPDASSTNVVIDSQILV